MVKPLPLPATSGTLVKWQMPLQEGNISEMQTLRPNSTVTLNLIPNSNGRSDATRRRLLIDTAGFPCDRGAYVIRFTGKQVHRLEGASPILRIGSADSAGGFAERIRQYNHQCDVTVCTQSLVDLLMERSQKTNVYLMYFLSHWAAEESFEVDLYFASQHSRPLVLEKQLLQEYLNLHHEFPPLNRGMR
jgi:hypothetical protein